MKLHHFFYRFALILVALLSLGFVIHLFILKSLDQNFNLSVLVYTYLALLVLTALIVFLIYKLQKKYFSQVGFMFLAGSMVKFAFYFLLLKPYYTHFELTKTKAFLVFFIPYIISLITEAIYVSKLLNNSQKKD